MAAPALTLWLEDRLTARHLANTSLQKGNYITAKKAGAVEKPVKAGHNEGVEPALGGDGRPRLRLRRELKPEIPPPQPEVARAEQDSGR